MVFLTALCYYDNIPQDFYVIPDVYNDTRTINNVVREWAPFQANRDDINFDCRLFFNGQGHVQILSDLLANTWRQLVKNLRKSFLSEIPNALDDNYCIYLDVNFHSRIPVNSNSTRDGYWALKPWNDLRQLISKSHGEYRMRLIHDYVLDLKSRIRNCPCVKCAGKDWDRDGILRISDLQLAELFEIWLHIKGSGDKEEYVWSFFANAVTKLDVPLTNFVYSFLDVPMCFFGLSNIIGCGQWTAQKIVKEWSQRVLAEEEKRDEEFQDELNNRPKKRRRIERVQEIGPLKVRTGSRWKRRTRTSVTRQFLLDYMEFFIECPPDESRPRLPILVRKEIYDNEYTYFMEAMHLPVVSYRWFNIIWKQEFGHCIMTDKRRFGQCNSCAELNRLYILATRTPDTQVERGELILGQSGHMEMIRNYRRIVVTWMKMAEREPTKHFFVMMDGMDQNKTEMPSEGRHRKSREGKNLYRIKLTNALTNHGNYFFWQDNSLKGTSNQIMYMLDLLFESVREKLGFLPRNLFLVFDSCSVNKCRKLFTFLSSFVAYSVFDEIQVIYLPVGHTHWFNDQIFSIISRKFHRTSCCIQSIQQFEDFLRTCYQPEWHKEAEKKKPKSQRRPFLSHVQQLEAIPDYTLWTRNFETSSFKNFPVQGRNRFEIFAVCRPGKEHVKEVQINAFVNSFTVEQNVQTYYSTSVHGFFGNVCLERIESGYKFADSRIEQVYRDFYYQVNQPVAHVVQEFWPQLTETFLEDNICDRLPSEDFKILNLRDLKGVVATADYHDEIVRDWNLRVFDKLNQRQRVQCPGCQALQHEDAEAHVAGRHVANVDELRIVSNSRRKRDSIRDRLQKHLLSEDHKSLMRWNFLTRLSRLQGNEQKFDHEQFEAFIRNETESGSWRKALFAKIGMFSNVALMEKRIRQLKISDCQILQQLRGTEMRQVQNLSSFILGVRAWHVQDGNTFWDHLGPADILNAFKEHQPNLSALSLESIPQPLDPSIVYIRLHDLRIRSNKPVVRSHYFQQFTTNRLARPYILEEKKQVEDVEMKAEEPIDDNNVPYDFAQMGWIENYGFLDTCQWGTMMRNKLLHVQVDTTEAQTRLIGKALFVLTPGNHAVLHRQDRDLVGHRRTNCKSWWKSVVSEHVYWDYCDDWQKPLHSSRSNIVQNIMIFLVLGFQDSFVFGHWMISEQNARNQWAESCWKRKLIPTTKNKTPGWVVPQANMPAHIKMWKKDGHLVSCFHIDILTDLLLWTHPFELIPVHSMEDVTTPTFSLPIRLIPQLRQEWGWAFVYEVFKM